MLKASLLGLMSCVAFDPAAAATFLIDGSVTRDATSKTVFFELEFSDSPDFFTTDEYNRSKDSFQIYVDLKMGPSLSFIAT